MGDPRGSRRERCGAGRAQRLIEEDEREPDSLRSVARDVAPRSAARRSSGIPQAAIAGGIGGLIAGVAGGVPYFWSNQDDDVPWRTLAPAFFTFVAFAGAVYASGARAGTHTLERGLGENAFRAIVGAIFGGALVGPAAGAVGVAYFGSQPYAFMGTSILALAPIAGAWLTSAAIAHGERKRAGAAPSILAMLGASLAATAIFGAIVAVLVAVLDDAALLAWFRSGARAADERGEVSMMGLAFVGVQAGAVLGAFVGGHIGVTTAIARAITRRR